MKKKKLTFTALFADWQVSTQHEQGIIEQTACALYGLGYWRLFDFAAFQELVTFDKVKQAKDGNCQ